METKLTIFIGKSPTLLPLTLHDTVYHFLNFKVILSEAIIILSEMELIYFENPFFIADREAWLLNGLVDSYLVSQSQQCAEILAGVEEPHDKVCYDLVKSAKRCSWSSSYLTLPIHRDCNDTRQ